MEELLAEVRECKNRNKLIAELLYQRKTEIGMKEFVSYFSYLVSVLSKVVLLKVSEPDIDINQMRIVEAIELLQKLMDGRDVVLLADILIYEINEELSKL